MIIYNQYLPYKARTASSIIINGARNTPTKEYPAAAETSVGKLLFSPSSVLLPNTIPPSGIKGDGIDADEYLELMGLRKPQLDGSSAFLTTSTAEDCSCCFGGISQAAESGVILTSHLAEAPAYAVSKVILAASESSETEYCRRRKSDL